MREPVDMPRLLDRAFELSDYHARSRAVCRARTQPARSGAASASPASCTAPGFTGSGEQHLASVVSVEAAADGHVRVLAASTEIGQGTNTIFAQIACDALGIECDDVEVAQPDTAMVPDSGPTVASRTFMVVGKLVETRRARPEAALIERRAASRRPTTPRHSGPPLPRTSRSNGSLRGTAQYQPPEGLRWDDEKYEGDAYGAYAWAVYVAEVAVDLVTFEIRVEDFVAVQEVGRVINPVLAAGQIEGGVAQGDRLGALRTGGLARRPHGQRPDDELHHADVDGSAADSRRVRRVPVPARPGRREGHRRAADGRTGAGDLQRGEKRDGAGRQPPAADA